MKRFLVLLFLSLVSLQSSAQRGAARQNIERVQAAKVAYITERVSLTADQAERFWPVYRRYQEELRAVRRAAAAERRARAGGATLTEAQSREAIEESLDAQEDQLALKRKYKDEFLRVISAQQLVQLYGAEQDFNRLLLQRLREQRGAAPRARRYAPTRD